ncbi:uncharacterized protein METZ01_LOCUS290166, partial [marine metagenome]
KKWVNISLSRNVVWATASLISRN